MARVSVIVPAFNAAATIEQTLRSVVSQTFEDWEVIVGDDRSTDGTADLARSVSPRITVVTATVNGGPAAARNLAMEHAGGELVALLDADDRWLPDYLASQVGAFDRAQGPGGARGDVGVVACDAYLEDASGARLSGTYRDRVPFPPEVTIETLLESNPIFVSALTPARLVREVGGFDPRTYGSEDHDLWCKLVERGYRVVDNPVPLAVYRVAASSVSSTGPGWRAPARRPTGWRWRAGGSPPRSAASPAGSCGYTRASRPWRSTSPIGPRACRGDRCRDWPAG